jgi:hypothetical protein
LDESKGVAAGVEVEIFWLRGEAGKEFSGGDAGLQGAVFGYVDVSVEGEEGGVVVFEQCLQGASRWVLVGAKRMKGWRSREVSSATALRKWAGKTWMVRMAGTASVDQAPI